MRKLLAIVLVFLILSPVSSGTFQPILVHNYYLANYVWDKENSMWVQPHASDGLQGSLDLRSNTDCGTKGGIPSGYGLFDYANPINDITMIGLGSDLNAPIDSLQKSFFGPLLNLKDPLKGSTIKDMIFEILTTQSDPTGVSNVKTLMPDDKGNLQLIISGDKLISMKIQLPSWRDKLFPENQPKWVNKVFKLKSPEWANILKTMQYDYAMIRFQDIQNGSTHYRQVLGAWMKQYNLDDNKIFLMAGIPNEGWAYPATTLSENWNCTANPTSITCQLTWTNIDFAWGIVLNQATDEQANSFTNYSRAESDLSSSNMTVQAQIIAVTAANSSDNRLGVAGRYDSATNTAYTANMGFRGDNAFKIRAEKIISDVPTTLDADIIITNNIPEPIKLSLNGSTIKTFDNGTQEHNFTDSSISSGLRGGVYSRDTGGVPATQILDDWTASDIISGISVKFPVRGNSRMNRR